MSIAKNFIYNVIYQIFILITPLITVPYVSRVLGSNGVGINAYTNSIIQYFILFGTIGIAMYGNRSIAYIRDDKEKRSKIFWSIFALKILTSTISFCFFIVFLFVVNEFQTIFLIQSIYIVSAALDITWLFMGLENFRKIVLRNLFVKVAGIICIFVFVQNANDLWKYVLALSLTELIGQLAMYMDLSKTVDFIRIKWADVKKHFLPAIALFLPQIAIQIYVVLNKTMLGIFSNTDQVGFFDNADKIIKMVLAVVTALGVVMLPRVSNTFAHGDTKKVKLYLSQSLDFVSYLSFPMVFGLVGTARGFTPWFFGPGFEATGELICIMSPIIIFIAWSNVLGVQYLVPLNRMRAFTVSVIIGATVNFIFNMLLIPGMESTGAAVSTVISEVTVTAVQLICVRSDFKMMKTFFSLWKYATASLIMYAVIRIIGIRLQGGIETTIVQVLSGICIYFALLFLFRSKTNYKIFNMTVLAGRKLIKKKDH